MDVSSRYQQLNDWFLTAHGEKLQLTIESLLQSVPMQNFSQRYLQIGSCGQNHWFSELHYSQKWLLSPCPLSENHLEADPYYLPFGSDALDVIFSPFALNMGLEPWRLIYALDQSLSSMGYLIFMGLNPMGIWRWSRFFGKKQWYQSAGGCSFWRLKAILNYFGYRQVDAQFFYFIPPVQNQHLISYFDLVDRFAKLIPPYPPAFYFLVMQKQELDFILSPVKPCCSVRGLI